MKKIYFVAIFLFGFSSFTPAEEGVLSEKKIAEVTQRLETYSTDQLVERRNFLIKSLQEDEDSEDDDSAVIIPPSTRSEMLFELSIIEQLLILAGVVLLDNISEDSTTPPDTVFPVLTVLGDNPATVELGDTYVDAGASSDGGEPVTTDFGGLDTSVVGSYTITYSATDAAGNTGTATRIVNVVDTTAPVVTVTGDNPATVELGSSYTDAGATATDASGSVTVVASGTVDTDTLGTYTITYTSTDVSGNTGTATRTVNVVDTTVPTITSPSSFSVLENQTSIGTVEVSDAGSLTFTVTGSDNVVIDQNGVLSFVVAPDYETQTVYVIVVTVTDESGNSVTQEITINVTNDPSDDEDDTGTGTGTGTGTTGTGTGTGTS